MRRKLLRIGAMAVLCFPGAAASSGAGAPPALPAVNVIVYPGGTITEAMITLKPAGAPGEAGSFVTEKQSLIGKVARRTLLPGLPIPKAAIREPYAVLQGKTVPLIFRSGPVTITGVALALESGSAGDVITARNPDTGIVIRGAVQPDGSLRVQ